MTRTRRRRPRRARARAPCRRRRPPDRPSRRWCERRKALLAWWKHTRPARANARFGARGGGVLTGGIAYAALFSVFAALTIGYTIFMAVLGDNDELREKVLDAIERLAAGPDRHGRRRRGLIDPDSLQLSGSLTVAGIVAVVVLLLSALSATAALRTGVRAMFGDERARQRGRSARCASSAASPAIARARSCSRRSSPRPSARRAVGAEALGWGERDGGVLLRVLGIARRVRHRRGDVRAGRAAARRARTRRGATCCWGAVIAGVGHRGRAVPRHVGRGRQRRARTRCSPRSP